LLMGGRQSEHGEAVGDVFLPPPGQIWRAFGGVIDDVLEPLFSRVARRAVKDTADGAGDFGALIQARDVGLGVLLEMELAARPRDVANDSFAGGGHAGVIVADDEGDAAKAALDEALEEGAPVGFGFTEGDADAQNGAFALGVMPKAMRTAPSRSWPSWRTFS